jgi:hypothetical protein
MLKILAQKTGKLLSATRLFFFPRFSELDLVTIVFLIMVFVAENLDYFVVESVKTIQNLEDALGALTVLLGIIFLIGAIAFLAIDKSRIGGQTKEGVIKLFYFIITLATLASLDPSKLDNAKISGDFVGDFQTIFYFAFYFRAVIAFLLLLPMVVFLLDREHIQEKHYSDEQMNLFSIILMVTLSFILYTWFRQDHNSVFSILASHFLVTSIIHILNINQAERILRNLLSRSQ